MFVLSNAWRAMTRSKGRTALTAFITLAVTFGTVAGLAIVQEHTTAHTTAYEAQAATLAVRPSAATWKKVSATDSSTTKYYMTWNTYTPYATMMQTAGMTLDSTSLTVTETVPARTTGKLKALDGDSLGSASDDATGGKLLWRSFGSENAVKANDLGSLNITDGKSLSFDTQSSSPDTTGALISAAFAKANDLAVGDTFKVAAASSASTTIELKVRGIYQYTSESTTENPVNAARNRENVIYTNYATFSAADLDPQAYDSSAAGWKLPDLDVVFSVTDASTYKTLVSTFKKSKLPESGYVVSSPSLEKYTKSLEPLDALASQAKNGVIVLLVVGGVLLLALVMLGVWTPKRNDEIGMALISGVSRGRLGWQFMLEVIFTTLPFYVIGLVAGAFAAKPIGVALASGHATAVTSGLIWQMVWCGLGTIVVLAILAALRPVFFGANAVFASEGDWGTVSEADAINAANETETGSNTTTTTDETDDDAEAKA
ncbi:ABC transporter permease [Bifidobacterium olomucense]|uniref:Peptide ABC transporter permease n=1 Tax=Bifidobacterium olomucense TaxID=2675324 RepID=A0A7Y0EXZ4_9BIFI|nr:ABC transporter permease [Bifidobacterium sp. DSM 109959]NMM98424.1 peptide ABC transporter permease [Bifidobacterium sp. DSM 109959]